MQLIFDNFILAEGLFAKVLQSFEYCALVMTYVVLVLTHVENSFYH